MSVPAPRRSKVCPTDMDSVADMHTRQINVLSAQVFENTAQLWRLQQQMNTLGTQLQRTQIHISSVDARVPSFLSVTAVIRVLATKINEVVGHVRRTTQAEEEASSMVADLQAINMELAMAELMREDKKASSCRCDWNQVCTECFPS